MYLIIQENQIIDGQMFYRNVSWTDYELSGDFYHIRLNDKTYKMPKDKAIESYLPTYFENVDPWHARYISRSDKTTDYIKRVKDEMGIDMTKNVIPDYRDGIDPMIDNGKSKL